MHEQRADSRAQARARLDDLGVPEEQLHGQRIPGDPIPRADWLRYGNPLHLIPGGTGEKVRAIWGAGSLLGVVNPNPLAHIVAPVVEGINEVRAQRKLPELRLKAEAAVAKAQAKEPTFAAALELAGAKAELDVHAIREQYPKEMLKHRVISAFKRPGGRSAQLLGAATALPSYYAQYGSMPFRGWDAAITKKSPGVNMDELRSLRETLK